MPPFDATRRSTRPAPASSSRRPRTASFPSLSELPGFNGYYLIEAGNGVISSVGLFDTAAHAEDRPASRPTGCARRGSRRRSRTRRRSPAAGRRPQDARARRGLTASTAVRVSEEARDRGPPASPEQNPRDGRTQAASYRETLNAHHWRGAAPAIHARRRLNESTNANAPPSADASRRAARAGRIQRSSYQRFVAMATPRTSLDARVQQAKEAMPRVEVLTELPGHDPETLLPLNSVSAGP